MILLYYSVILFLCENLFRDDVSLFCEIPSYKNQVFKNYIILKS